ncbi:DUF1198 domain-containing protein [Obesumbacterium proteus]|uniref:DUF1198 family protein n=1 Tax=Obesumbacterium proteus TaxID=82983 RepID=UPI001033D832|nr:DUF1198 family protein [Obesumbacterium proteus]TBL73170.1 DUF1198 domain-containing protein [Obesumbacterium proteus]
MIWLMLATLVVVFIVGFRVLNSDARRASQALTKRLNIEPVYVESMLSQMGKTAGGEFISYLLQDNESHMGNAAGVLLIYQTFIVDESDESLTFWRSVLRKAHLSTEITHKHVRLALTFLRELEPDPNEMSAYRLRYNARFTAISPEGSAANSNVYYMDGSSEQD